MMIACSFSETAILFHTPIHNRFIEAERLPAVPFHRLLDDESVFADLSGGGEFDRGREHAFIGPLKGPVAVLIDEGSEDMGGGQFPVVEPETVAVDEILLVHMSGRLVRNQDDLMTAVHGEQHQMRPHRFPAVQCIITFLQYEAG